MFFKKATEFRVSIDIALFSINTVVLPQQQQLGPFMSMCVCSSHYNIDRWDAVRVVINSSARMSYLVRVLVYISFELRCLSSFSVAWEGEQLADMSTAFSNYVSCPHVFAHERIPLPSLPGFYSTISRMTTTPNGPAPLYSLPRKSYTM